MYSRRIHVHVQSIVLFAVGAVLLMIALFPALAAHARSADVAPHVDVMALNTDIGPSSLQFLRDSIRTAENDGAQALIIEVDSPGGDIASMQSMTEAELTSGAPIITYVTPSGAYAASAAAFVTLAAPIAVMAPTTRIGASSPINSDGSNIASTLKSKIENDLIQSMTGMQTRYHRDVSDAIKMVTNAASYNDALAEQLGIVNRGATSLSDVLQQVDGQVITLTSGQTVTLHTAGAAVQTLQPSLFDSLYGFLLDPNVIFLLFIVAMIGMYLEISHPGAILPGTVGAIALLLFLFAAGSIAPNWAGLTLMILAFVLLVLDLRVPTHGVLTVGAVISLIVGALLFFNSGGPYGGPHVNPYVVFTMAAVIALLSFALIAVIVRVQHRPVATGVEGMIGMKAITITPLLPEGRVNYGGENWSATLLDPTTSLDAGCEVQVVSVQGLRLFVEPVHFEPSHPVDADINSHAQPS